jgi:hypothetical protein
VGSLYICHDKYIKDGKVLGVLGFKTNVFPGPLTNLSAWVGFFTSSPQQGVQYKLSYLNFFLWRGSLKISHEKYIKESRVLFNLEIRSSVLLGP